MFIPPPLHRAVLPIALILAVAACARELPLPAESPATSKAPYPRLVPLESIAALPAPEDPAAELQARADALKARASAMQTAE